MLNIEEKTQIIEIINSDILKLTKRVDDLRDFTGPVAPDDAIGRISRMDAINNKSVFDASMGNLQSRLKQLIHILTIVDDKDYGICSRCHQSIPMERLKIRPEVRHCASCMSR